MSEVVQFQRAEDPRDAIHRAVHLLADGELVALPTDTVYCIAASALHEAAVRRLGELAGSPDRPPSHHQSESPVGQLVLRDRDELADFVGEVPPVAQRLTRRCWPGPLTLALPTDPERDLLGRLPHAARAAVVGRAAPAPELWCRMPAHRVLQQILPLLPGPLVISGERTLSGAPAGRRPDEFQEFNGQVALVIDDGPCHYQRPATTVRTTHTGWHLVEEGAVSETMLRRLAGQVYLFVCTGNTCRSPMAEALFRKVLADRLGCGEDELPDRGYTVASAGLAASHNMPAAREAVDAVREYGANLISHASQPLTAELLEQCDRVFTMTRGHMDSILIARPDLADRVSLLAADGSDISDPIGSGPDEYEQCCREIEGHVRALVDALPKPHRG